MTVPLSIFSEKDQAYIKGWNQNQAFLNNRFFAVDAKRIKKKSVSKGTGDSSMATTYYDHCFNLILNNKSTTDFNEVTVNYVIYYSQDHHINRKLDKELREGHLCCETKVSIPKRTEKELETEKLCLQTYRESGYDLTWPDLDGDVEGILVRLSMETESGEQITRNFSYPKKFQKPWLTESKHVEPKR